MSADTKQALEEALAAHVADECDGDMIGGWVVVAETTNLDEFNDGTSSFYKEARSSQSGLLTTGLLWQALEHGRFRTDDD